VSRGLGFRARLVATFALVIALAAHASAASAAGLAAGQSPADPNQPYPPPSPRLLVQPDRSYTYASPQPFLTPAWLLLQLLPSPEVAVGRVHEPNANGITEPKTEAAFGLRWQVTPLLWSWGTNRRVSRWRSFVVDPLARHAGSLELSGSIDWFFGNVDRAIVRPGVRAYFPVAQRGEYLSVSLGTSTYAYDEKMRVAYDVGAYVLWGLFGVQATIAPENGPLTAIGTFRIRYF
jgi:hypothetical protein